MPVQRGCLSFRLSLRRAQAPPRFGRLRVLLDGMTCPSMLNNTSTRNKASPHTLEHLENVLSATDMVCVRKVLCRREQKFAPESVRSRLRMTSPPPYRTKAKELFATSWDTPSLRHRRLTSIDLRRLGIVYFMLDNNFCRKANPTKWTVIGGPATHRTQASGALEDTSAPEILGHSADVRSMFLSQVRLLGEHVPLKADGHDGREYPRRARIQTVQHVKTC